MTEQFALVDLIARSWLQIVSKFADKHVMHLCEAAKLHHVCKV
ncbi:hypothetical protein L810_3570 [Burkholderia sp. AU4i]|nr:hypothetical protein L810_3570 [Burkholderia sp. AU4i]